MSVLNYLSNACILEIIILFIWIIAIKNSLFHNGPNYNYDL